MVGPGHAGVVEQGGSVGLTSVLNNDIVGGLGEKGRALVITLAGACDGGLARAGRADEAKEDIPAVSLFRRLRR